MQEVPGSNAERIAGSIEFKNVSFRYNEERSIFNSLSFRINTREKIAIESMDYWGRKRGYCINVIKLR